MRIGNGGRAAGPRRARAALVALLVAAALVCAATASAFSSATVLSASATSVAPGEAVTFTATVTGGDPGDTVGFSFTNVDTGTLTTATATLLENGTAQVTTSFAAGAYDVTASDLPGPTSNTVRVTVAQTAPSKWATSVSLETPTIVPGNPATFTATVVRSDGSPVPGGTVTFWDNSSPFGSAAVVEGVATFTGGSFANGTTHTFYATYGGDATDDPAQPSAPLTVTIPGLPSIQTAIDVGYSSPSPAGQQVTLIVHVYQVGGTLQAPENKVSIWFNGATAADTRYGATLGADGYATIVLPGLAAGETYDFQVKYTGDATFPSPQPATVTISFLAGATVTAPDATMVYGGAVPTLAPTYSAGATPATPATCAAAGVTSATPPGTYAIDCSGAADPEHAYTYVPGWLTIEKAPLTVTAPTLTGYTTVPLPALAPTLGGFVGADTQASATSGSPSCDADVPPGQPAGIYTIRCTAGDFASDRYELARFVDGTLTILAQIPVTVTAPSPQISYGDAIPTLGATYSPAVSPATPAGCTTTASAGSAPGTYTVTCGGASDSRYAFAYVDGTLTIAKAATTLAVDPLPVAAVGSPATVRATVSSRGHAAGAGLEVVFALGGGSCTATTGAAGVAACSLTPAGPTGPGATLTAHFAGDDDYTGSDGSTQTVLYALASGTGTFTIGDREAQLGARVTFWGAQWSTENALTTGRAPSSFKGWALAADPVPGAVWTTGPGNSPPPPAGQPPRYLGVFVTRAVDRHGATLSGTVARIAVVEVDPGYHGDPGHAGTGAVVALG